MTKRILNRALTLLPILFLGGCQSLLHDQLKECPREIEVSLYTQTDCDAARTYPSDVKSVLLIAYNEKGEAVATQTHEGPISAETKVRMTVPAGESVRVAAWSGLYKDYFALTPNAKLSEQFVQLKAGQDLKDQRIRQGISREVALKPLNEEGANEVTSVEVNLLELTNRIKVHIIGLEDPDKISVEVVSANDRYSAEGKMLGNNEATPYPYPTTITTKANTFVGPVEPGCEPGYDGELTAELTTLLLRSGHNSWVTMRKAGQEHPFFRSNLIGLLMSAAKDGADINLYCDHDFTVELKVRRCPNCSEGYQVAWVKINNWQVHSYDTELAPL